MPWVTRPKGRSRYWVVMTIVGLTTALLAFLAAAGSI